MRRTLALILIAAFVVSCSSEASPEPEPEVEVLESFGHTAVAFKGDGDGFLPTVEQVSEAEAALSDYLAKNRESTDMRADWMTHNRQYAGVNTNGKQSIEIAGFCVRLEGFTEERIGVEDGGPCFWNADFEVDTGKILSIRTNGQA